MGGECGKGERREERRDGGVEEDLRRERTGERGGSEKRRQGPK